MQLSQQVESMRVLMNTTNYAFGQIKSKMDITYPHRQRIVRDMRPIKEIVKLSPALSVTNLFVREMNRHSAPYDGDIIQALKSNCSRMVGDLDQPEKKYIDE
ncbi:unnamed protein product, partial [Didymodactylos carnosus]